jgi:hypothetical protein
MPETKIVAKPPMARDVKATTPTDTAPKGMEPMAMPTQIPTMANPAATDVTIATSFRTVLRILKAFLKNPCLLLLKDL